MNAKLKVKFTVRDRAGVPIGHGATPDAALREVVRRGSGAPATIERRLAAYPFTTLEKVPVGRGL